MKKNYFSNALKGILFLAVLFHFNLASAQMEIHVLDANGFGTSLLDINDSGQGVVSGGTYDFLTNTLTPLDPEVQQLNGINNNGDLIGVMPLTIGPDTTTQPAYKTGGIWHPIGLFPGSSGTESSFTAYQISENGNYIVGQMSPDCCNAQAFLYDVSTSTLEQIADPANEYSAGYTVNDSGILGGWYDPQPSGTLRVPAYMTTGSVITSVPAELPASGGQVGAITNSNLMVGERDGKPFIFDQNTNTFTEFNVPAGFESASFTSISDNGIAVGYCQIFDFNGLTREALVYHPSLGSQPVFLKDILIANGLTINTIDGNLGTAIAISPDGNFICGWENVQFIFAHGWAVNLKDLLISNCYATCPQDIAVTNLSGSQVINYDLSISCDTHPGSSLVLVSGLASGSVFPLGTTTVTHNLIDIDGTTVLNTCSFDVTITDQYCNPSNINNFVEPITLVSIATINNTSSATATVDYEDFTSIVGAVSLGASYTGIFEGYTGGDYTDFFRVFVDWNQNGAFDSTTESYDMGSITNSTGIDGIQTSGTLTVPTDAILGTTTLRVIKNYDHYTNNACSIDSSFGQVEDYKLIVDDGLATTGFSLTNFKIYPNPVKDILNISNTTIIESVSIINVLGQIVFRSNPNNTSSQLNLVMLPAGSYIVKASSGSDVKILKIIKE